jgi:hypothetical protein
MSDKEGSTNTVADELGRDIANQGNKKANSARLNGVDLIAIAILGVLARALYYPYSALGIVFPYNTGVLSGFMTFAGIIAASIVSKRGTLVVYSISWLIISYLFQGENVVYLTTAWFPFVFGELVALLFKKENYATTLLSAIVIGVIYGLFYQLSMFFFITFVAKLVFPLPVWLGVFGVALVADTAASILGFFLGKKLKKVTRGT